jgi:hypothetical protein
MYPGIGLARLSFEGPLDLAAAFRSAYDLTTGDRPIDYETEPVPEPALAPEDVTWAATLLKALR